MRAQCDQLTVKYGSFTALNHVTFQVPEGQYLALLGENGAGKSTLLRALAGWFRATSGTITINDCHWEQQERKMRQIVKLVPDTPQFYPDLTVAEHLELVAKANRVSDWQEAAQNLLVSLGISQQPRAYPSSFSRGMQYKLALTMALITRPQLLLLDEPFGALDPYSQSHLADKIRQLAAEGQSVVLSTHVLPDNAPPHRIVILDQGHLVQDASLEAIWNPDDDGPIGALPQRILTKVLGTVRSTP